MAADRPEAMQNEKEEETDASPEMMIKHPLQNKWTLWFYKHDKNRSWEDSQIEIASFDTVEDFWALYNHIEVASLLPIGCDYSLFKQGIKPMWEDERNKKGGRWLINLCKQQRSSELDNFWLEVLLLLVGESFEDHSDDICGAVVNVRPKGDKIGVWTGDSKKPESILRIGKKLKSSLGIPAQVSIMYQIHESTAKKTGSYVRSHFTC
ncbi:eukaryotic translation initiation factor 4E-1A-like isoform X2 [Oratosquilla oratoria]|uniref:eukaryotic translation initiation factor 4E-1A-like isoform X2 n=1 Tax=Oratosquilla oratoria TaxID=337810 RepID=UPI003F7688A9